MSIGQQSIGEAPLAAQAPAQSLTSPPPPKRVIIARSDPVQAPEPR